MKELRTLLIESFDLEELRTLCFDVDIHFASLAGSTLDSKARELIAICQRQNRLTALLAACRQQRPQVAWPDLAGETAVPLTTDPLSKLRITILDNIKTSQKQINILCLLEESSARDAQLLAEAINLGLKVDEKLFLTLASFRHDVVAILRSLANMVSLPHPPFVCITFVDLAAGRLKERIEQVRLAAPTAVFILYTTPTEFEQCWQTLPTEWAADFGHYHKLFKQDGLSLAAAVRKVLQEARETAVRKMELQIRQDQL